MIVERKDLDTVRILCRRPSRRGKKCYACSAPATVLCDHPQEPPEGVTAEDLAANPELAVELTTCSRPACGAHAAWWTGQKHLCKEHAIEKGVWC